MNRIRAWAPVFYAALALLFAGGKASGQTAFATGEELFMRNNPQEALGYLERAVTEDPAHVQAVLYLGIVYQQLGRPDDAIAAYRKLLPKGGVEGARVAFSLGNVYFSKGNMEFAKQYYTQAIQADPAWAPSYLNRANAQIRGGALNEAVADYEQYLTLEPGSAQRSQIERLIALIREESVSAERQRAQAEEAARREAERKQRLLDEISTSLQSAADNSQGLSAGPEAVQGYEGEFELE